MKTCSLCKKQFPIEMFAFKNKSLGKRNAMCHDCRHSRQKESYYKHHQTNLDRIYKRKQSNIDWVKEIRSSLSCCICGESDESCLDFHHLDSSKKDFNIGSSSRIGKSIETIKQEINKCACLCSNCHRKFHAGKLNLPLKKLNVE